MTGDAVNSDMEEMSERHRQDLMQILHFTSHRIIIQDG
jgi:hypothetical protein